MYIVISELSCSSILSNKIFKDLFLILFSLKCFVNLLDISTKLSLEIILKLYFIFFLNSITSSSFIFFQGFFEVCNSGVSSFKLITLLYFLLIMSIGIFDKSISELCSGS